MAVSMYGQVAIQATMPAEDPIKVGSLWVDTSGTATLKVCTSISPYTFASITGGASAWGSITGTLSSQTDLQTALDAKSPYQTEQTTSSTGTVNNLSLSARLTVLRCTNASALTITGMTIGGNAPSAGDTVIIENVGSSTVKLAHQDTNSTAANRCIGTSIQGQILGAGGSLIAVYDGTTSRWRMQCIQPGAAIAVPYASGDYTTGAGTTWTVDSGDLIVFTYRQWGTLVTITLTINTSTVSGTQTGSVYVKFPNGFTVSGNPTAIPFGRAYDGSWTNAMGGTNVAAIGGTKFQVLSLAGTVWNLATDGFYVQGVATFEVD